MRAKPQNSRPRRGIRVISPTTNCADDYKPVQEMNKNHTRNARVLVILAVVLVLLLLLIVWGVATRRAPAYPPSPSPNGYDKIVTATVEFDKQGLVSPYAAAEEGQTPSSQEVDEYLAAYEDVLADLPAALELQARMPDPNQSNISDFSQILTQFREASRLLDAAARRAIEREEYDKALELSTLNVKLGIRVQHGVLLHTLVGVGIEKAGKNGISTAFPSASTDAMKAAAKRLLEIERERVPFNEVKQMEYAASYSYQGGLQNFVLDVTGVRKAQLDAALATAEEHLVEQSRQLRILAAELLVNAHFQETGDYPAALADVAPDGVDPALLRAPTGAEAIRYQQTQDGAGYELSSHLEEDAE